MVGADSASVAESLYRWPALGEEFRTELDSVSHQLSWRSLRDISELWYKHKRQIALHVLDLDKQGCPVTEEWDRLCDEHGLDQDEVVVFSMPYCLAEPDDVRRMFFAADATDPDWTTVYYLWWDPEHKIVDFGRASTPVVPRCHNEDCYHDPHDEAGARCGCGRTA